MLHVSGAVGDDGAPARDFLDSGLKLFAPDAQRPRYLHVALSPVTRVARIYKDWIHPLLDQPPGLLRADQLDLRLKLHQRFPFNTRPGNFSAGHELPPTR